MALSLGAVDHSGNLYGVVGQTCSLHQQFSGVSEGAAIELIPHFTRLTSTSLHLAADASCMNQATTSEVLRLPAAVQC